MTPPSLPTADNRPQRALVGPWLPCRGLTAVKKSSVISCPAIRRAHSTWVHGCGTRRPHQARHPTHRPLGSRMWTSRMSLAVIATAAGYAIPGPASSAVGVAGRWGVAWSEHPIAAGYVVPEMRPATVRSHQGTDTTGHRTHTAVAKVTTTPVQVCVSSRTPSLEGYSGRAWGIVQPPYPHPWCAHRMMRRNPPRINNTQS